MGERLGSDSAVRCLGVAGGAQQIVYIVVFYLEMTSGKCFLRVSLLFF